MKLLVRRLWFPYDVDATVTALFRVPQIAERFSEGYAYDGNMRPRGIRICPGYWPADAIMARLPQGEKNVYLVLTSMDLKGDHGRIHGKGRDRVAIASSYGFTDFSNSRRCFNPSDVGFHAMAFGEVGHALGLEHHRFDPSNPCEMSHNEIPGPEWRSLKEVHFCDDCYKMMCD